MQHNGWDYALKVTADGKGLVGHAGAVLLRKAADQAGLTAGLGAALRKAGQSPLAGTPAVLDRIARARARARPHAWKLIEDTPSPAPPRPSSLTAARPAVAQAGQPCDRRRARRTVLVSKNCDQW